MHTQIAEDEAQAWADGQWSKSQANRIGGKIKCEGIGSVAAGDRVSLGGVGERFNGDAYVTAVRHDFDLVQGWKTWLRLSTQKRRVSGRGSPVSTRAPSAAGSYGLRSTTKSCSGSSTTIRDAR
jgi:phage protein D